MATDQLTPILLETEWHRRLVAALPTLTASQRRIAEYINENQVGWVFMTTFQLAQQIGVSEASIVRFANALKYSGYTALQQEARLSIEKALSPIERFLDAEQQRDSQSEDVLVKAMTGDLQSIKASLESLNRHEFFRASQILSESASVYVVGMRAGGAVAMQATIYLSQIRPDVHLVEARFNRVSDELMRLDASSAMLVIHFTRYNRQTLDAVRFARRRGARVILITDSLLAPSIPFATVVLALVPFVSGFFSSHVVTHSLVNALVLEVARLNPDRTRHELEQFEQALTDFEIPTDALGQQSRAAGPA